jgi:VanZ family protein
MAIRFEPLWKRFFTILLVAYAIGMFVIAILPGQDVPNELAKHDKAIHFAEFFVFTILLITTLHIDGVKWTFLVAGGAALVMIYVSELIQTWTATRSFDVHDMLFDLAGVLLAMAIMGITIALSTKKNP